MGIVGRGVECMFRTRRERLYVGNRGGSYCLFQQPKRLVVTERRVEDLQSCLVPISRQRAAEAIDSEPRSMAQMRWAYGVASTDCCRRRVEKKKGQSNVVYRQFTRQ
jgi:hypothetical protein